MTLSLSNWGYAAEPLETVFSTLLDEIQNLVSLSTLAISNLPQTLLDSRLLRDLVTPVNQARRIKDLSDHEIGGGFSVLHRAGVVLACGALETAIHDFLLRLIAPQPADMRKSYNGLQALARPAMGRDPLDGALYVFINRRGSQIKCLYFDRSGFLHLGQAARETGKFIGDWHAVRTREMDWTGLKLLLEGLEGKRVRKRFSLPSAVIKSL